MRDLKRIILLTAFVFVFFVPLSAQLVIQDVLTDVELVEQILLGEGVQVYNITSTGANQAIGEFDTGAGDPDIPMSHGIIMSSGDISDAPGPNSSDGTSSNNAQPGDTDLTNIIGLATRDAAVIEFDFKSPSDTVRFNYIFASEEYREYVCNFNDAFAFLLTGPNPLGGNYTNYNIALVPGTSTEVAIATVNNGDSNSTCAIENSNSGYYIDNAGGFFVEYDGLTQMFTAKAIVVPCQEYHIKLVIADAVDGAFDSAVFLEANSFGANVDTLIADFVHDGPACTDENIQFLNAGPSGSGVTYEWTFGGTASQATSTDENPTVSWSTLGLKQVDLKIIINCGMDSAMITKFVNVYPEPNANFSFTDDICENGTVQFTNTGSSGGEFTHEWIFTTDAEPMQSFSENPSVTFSSSGTKPVQHIVYNDNCSHIIYDTVNILVGPTAMFTYTGPVCTNQTVDFTNTGTNVGVSFDWAFSPDGTPLTSILENPTGISFASAGTKVISLTVMDIGTGCQKVYETDLQILDVPSADFTFINNVCIGTGLDFVNAGSSGNEFLYSWDFGTNATPNQATSENPENISFNSSGPQNITLTVSNSYCNSSINHTLNIEDSPAPEILFTSTAPQCDGSDIDFSFDQDPTGLDFNWDFGVNANPIGSTDINPLGITFNTEGVQMVSLTVTDQLTGCWNSIDHTINILETPIASFNFVSPTCVNALVDFTNNGSTGQEFSYVWDFGANATPSSSNAENPTGIMFGDSGNQIITLTVSTPDCIATSTETISIDNSPAPILDFSSTSPVCSENEISFSISNYDASLDYTWDFGADASPVTSNDQEPVVVYHTDGIMSVQLYAVDLVTGCDNYIVKNVQIYPRPDASFSSNAPVCIGETVNFNNLGSSGTEFSYTWDFGQDANPPISNAENPGGVVYSSSGDKDISLTIASANCTRTVSQSITVFESPMADFTTNAPQCTGQPVQMHNLSVTNDLSDYQWNFGDGASISNSTDINPLVIYTDPGNHEVNLIVTNSVTGCQDSIVSFINIYSTPIVAFSSNAPLCPNESVSFTNEGSSGIEYTYSWSFGRYGQPSSSMTENPTGIVFTQGGQQSICLTVSNNECSNSAYQTIDIHPLPVANAGIDTIICANRSVMLGIPEVANHTYLWLPATIFDDNQIAQATALPQAEFTTCFLTVTDINTGCQNLDSVNVTMLAPAIASAGEDVSICAFESVQVGTGQIDGQIYQWIPITGVSDPTSSNPLVSPSESIVYTLNVSYGNCDVVSDQVAVTVHPLPNINAGVDQTIAVGEQIRLNATGGVNYQWSPIIDISNPYIPNPMVSPDDTITYIVIGSDVFGCIGTDSINIFVKEPAFYIPNSFTPNNDGRNDVFYVRGNPITDYKLQIFNRYNQSVYITGNYYEGWDGTIQNTGDECGEGAYVYILTGIDENGESVAKTGILNLIR